jgi:hypothetical protein
MWYASQRGGHRHALLLYLCQYLFLHLFCLRLRLCMASLNTFTTKHLDLYSIPDIKADSRGTPVDTETAGMVDKKPLFHFHYLPGN